jgi:hypothetical protein
MTIGVLRLQTSARQAGAVGMFFTLLGLSIIGGSCVPLETASTEGLIPHPAETNLPSRPHEIFIFQAAVQPKSRALCCDSLCVSGRNVHFERVDVEHDLFVGLENLIKIEGLTEFVDGNVRQIVADGPPPSNFDREGFGAAVIGKFETLKAEMLRSRLVAYLHNPLSEANWFGLDDRQFESERRPGAHVGRICGDASRAEQTYGEKSEYNGEDCDDDGRKCINFVMVGMDEISSFGQPNGEHSVRRGAVFFVGLFCFGCFAIIFWRLLA